jgi:uncharacterized protein YuzE
MTYDKKTDVLYIRFSENKISVTEEAGKNVVLDYGENNDLVGIEISYFVKKHKKEVYPVFKEVERAVQEP